MTAVPEAPAPSPGIDPQGLPATSTPNERSVPRWALVVAVLVVAAGVVLRFVTRSDLWLDEALTVNIARLPLSDLHEALRHDGAPPLFYLLLHGWISVFGHGDVAVRALPGLFSVATLPVIWLGGRRLGRPGPPGRIADDPADARLVAGLCVVVLATSPFAIRYATEARMYSLVMLLVAIGYLALRRALERPSLGRLAIVALLAAMLLYTQYWSMYLLAVVGLAMLWCAVRAPTSADRHAARGVLVAFVAALVIFSPWIPTFVYQSAHTGTPWGSGVSPLTTVRTALDQFANGTSLFHTQANVLGLVCVLLGLLAVFGRASGRSGIDVDLRTYPAVRWEAAAAVGALTLGLTAAYVTDTAFDARYASMMFPLFVLVVAFGFTGFGSRAVMGVAVAIVVVSGLVGGYHNVVDNRTQAGEIADAILARAKPGDAVVYCPDQLGPAVARLLEGHQSLEQITFPAGDPPELIDWVDYRDRIDATSPTTFAADVRDRVGKGHTIWYVYSPAYYGVEGKCEAVAAGLGTDRAGAQTLVTMDAKAFFESGSLVEYPAG
jgi:hypothetical protein